MNTRYVIGIVITIALLSLNQIFIQYWLAQKKYDAKTINIAGKQRMLSQRINAEFYRVQHDKTSTDLLENLLEQWKTAHLFLQSDDDSNNEAPIKNQEIRLALKELNPNIEFAESQLDHLKKGNIQLHQITENQTYFLPKMDGIVKRLELDADKKLKFIVRTEYLLFFFSLIILTLEVIYIYVPIERSLKSANNEVEDKNEKLNHAIGEIQKKNKELAQITYITSHDLQEPVRTISNCIQLFKEKYGTGFDKRGIKMLDFLDDASERMRNLIKDLLDYSILGKEKAKIKINCNQLLEEIVQDLDLRISTSNAKITWNELPVLTGIRAEIRLLLQNLISNGLKFQKPNNVPKIEIKSIEKKNCWLLSVTDNGIGIEANQIEKVFSIFHRIHSREKYEGTGIGLAHCSKIIEIHGGQIWVESQPNVGSTFFFTIQKTPLEVHTKEEVNQLQTIG